ncbi:uncharacterized protein LOC117176644 [Belonocnema kinseyi]|uniref:uncharacterized protein LOC117176644 n=1 Tax=Belonocnema kinseyi TaxID=2817044 RepID=UPI00143CC272|nr:uncharacterized protein LOC117176644 [Belonocnema kinseyi]
MRVLQINTNRSKSAHDLALSTAMNMRAGILVLSEPNKRSIEGRNDWVFDESVDTAIKVLDKSIAIKEQGKGTGFFYVATTSFTIYSCYASPNKKVEELEALLQQIGNCIRTRGEEAIVAGDFNAKSPQWGMKRTDGRGRIITEWLAQDDLIVKNKGENPTFVRKNYGSILDLTIATTQIGKKIHQWKVSEEESLSDHNYVTFEIVEIPRSVQKKREKIGKTVHKSQPMYWWNEDIAKLRKVCIEKRRKHTGAAKKNVPLQTQKLWKEYVCSKKELQGSIKAAKKKGWTTVRDEIDRDVWRKGYEIVRNFVHSQLLYAAPVWHKAIKKKKHLRRKLERVQKVAGIRVASAYRTISTEGIGVIAEIPPIELLVQERVETYEGKPRKEAREDLMVKWQEKWMTGTHGRWTWHLLPKIQKWIERGHGETDYFLTQALSGHGCFREYLFKRKRAATDRCPYCNEVDDLRSEKRRSIRACGSSQ